MTKIYLVCSKVTHSNELPKLVEVEAFTNHKLAEAYCNYWNMKAKKWDEKLGKWEFYITTREICKIDYSEEVIKMKIEELPY